MIGMLKGTVWTTDGECLVLDVAGVGYLLYVPAGCLADLQVGEELTFYTHLQVREDDMTLYGFREKEEKQLFLQLLSVSGIGPKGALAILSALSVSQVKAAILQENVALLTQVPGIGAKTAKRIIIDLKEKIQNSESDAVDKSLTEGSEAAGTAEALETLLALGFSRNEAREALHKTQQKGINGVEDQVKEALRLLASR